MDISSKLLAKKLSLNPEFVDVLSGEEILFILPELFLLPTIASDLSEVIADKLEQEGLLKDLRLLSFQEKIISGNSSDFEIQLRVQILSRLGKNDELIKVLDECFDRLALQHFDNYLLATQVAAKREDFSSAYKFLSNAVASTDDFTKLNRAANTFLRLRKIFPDGFDAKRSKKLAVLSNYTTAFLIPILRILAFRDGIDLDIYEAPYGSMKQDILNLRSELYVFKPDFVLLHVNYHDLHLPCLSENSEQAAKNISEEWLGLLQQVHDRLNCCVLLNKFDFPLDDAAGFLSGALVGGRRRLTRSINALIEENLTTGVFLLDTENIAASFGRERWDNPLLWNRAKQYPSTLALPYYAENVIALLRAHLGLSKKVLILDLDNTLWGGVIGEDGVDGIKIGQGDAESEAFANFQQYVLDLKNRGIVLAVCSKNNEVDALLPFDKHSGMLLHRDDIAIFKANWNDKAQNIREIALELNLGLDSFVFVDDNPAECQLVRRNIPEVTVIQLPSKSPEQYVHLLDSGRYFEALHLSEEDKKRAQAYADNAKRAAIKTAVGDLESYLHSLQMVADWGRANEKNVSRVVQLLGKTNQFNLTTKRHTFEDVQRMMQSLEFRVLQYSLRDQFGDNGLIGVVILKQSDATVWEIDTWLMSCRVIGRTMEEFMMNTIAETVINAEGKELRASYLPTAKNGLVKELLPTMGFQLLEETADGSKYYTLLLSKFRPKKVFISAGE